MHKLLVIALQIMSQCRRIREPKIVLTVKVIW